VEPQKRIIVEPVSLIREAARKSMQRRMGVLVFSAAIYLACLSIPVIIVEQIAGLWDVYEEFATDYLALLGNPTPDAMNDLFQTYSGRLSFNFATYVFFLFVPGPLTLGLSALWLRVLRGKTVYSDMVFSGFNSFLRVVAMDFVRRLIIILFAILLIVPGVIMYYRYSLTFFLMADNPSMMPLEALSQSRYYMQQNKGSRFALDLSFLGWFAASVIVFFLLSNGIFAFFGEDTPFFTQQLVSNVLSSIVFAPVFAYRGVAAAEYYHRVICKDPRSFHQEPLELPKT
jgi:uncharacterized membrane protein